MRSKAPARRRAGSCDNVSVSDQGLSIDLHSLLSVSSSLRVTPHADTFGADQDDDSNSSDSEGEVDSASHMDNTSVVSQGEEDDNFPSPSENSNQESDSDQEEDYDEYGLESDFELAYKSPSDVRNAKCEYKGW